MISVADREKFDLLLEAALDALPPQLLELLDESPLIVDDEPSEEILRQMEIGDDGELLGLHSGIAMTDRSVEHSGVLPEEIRLYRGPILRVTRGRTRALREQIRITLLHEIGHHFGLDEDDLDDLGYG